MDQVAPVLTYDGARIPFADGVFDIVFSSNVLKHIADLERVQEELKRVLKDDGIAIHIVPSGTWRFWTNVAHPVFLLKHLFSYVTRRPQIWSAEDKAIHSDPVAAPDGRYSLVFPDRHGETGNFLTEIYYFSRFRWDGLFVKTGWRIAKRQANRLFYTGYVLTGLKLSWRLRELMALVLGSACHLYVLRKSTQTS